MLEKIKKKNPYDSFWDNLLYLMKNWFRWDAKGRWMILLSIPINVMIPLLYAYLPKILTQAVEQHSRLDLIFRQLLLVSGLFILAHWFREYVQVKSRSFQFSDRVIVFDQGKIVQEGSHEELVAVEGKYRDMWQAQAKYFT